MRRIFIVGTVIFGIAAGARSLRTGIEQFRFRLNASRQRDALYGSLLQHTVPEGTVVFDESKDSLPVLCYVFEGSPYFVRFRGDTGITPPPQLSDPAYDSCLQALTVADFWAATGLRRTRCLPGLRQILPSQRSFGESSGPPFTTYPGNGIALYIHRGRTRGGIERLIAVSFSRFQFTAGDTSPLTICAYSPGWTFRGGNYRVKRVGLGFACGVNESLRFYAGQPDPADPSHFTIPYSVGPRSGTLDGRLTEDGNDVQLIAHESDVHIPLQPDRPAR